MNETFEFTLVLGPTAAPDLPDLENRLFEAGCDDALVCAYGSTVYLQFSRESVTAKSAIQSAIQDVEKSGFSVASIEEGGYASVSEMASRAGMTRAAINNYLKGTRGSQDFPHPVFGLSTRSPQFEWLKVAAWLNKHGKIDPRVAEVARAAKLLQVRVIDKATKKKVEPGKLTLKTASKESQARKHA